MSATQKLVFSIIEFLDDQISRGKVEEDDAESLEVAKQCLESAFRLDMSLAEEYRVPLKLRDIFSEATGSQFEEEDFTFVSVQGTSELKPEDIEMANKLKEQGNEFMKSERYEEALDAYSKAIQIDPKNAVYYCNRAAAYSKMEKHRSALNDCDRALRFDVNYSKAYGRKGLAHAALNQYFEAIQCYEKALEHDPDNQSYINNLDVAKQKLSELSTGGPSALEAGGGGPFGMDFSQLMNNPAIMNMAQSLMSNPQMQNMMSNIMRGGAGEGQEQEQGAPLDMNAILTAGQQLAQQMQDTNPELVEQLRSQMNTEDPTDSTDDNSAQ